MAEDLYAKPDMTQKTRREPGEPEEDGGNWVEKTVDIYAGVDSAVVREGKHDFPRNDVTGVFTGLIL